MIPDMPTYEQAEQLARTASANGFGLKLEENKKGWRWAWLHKQSGMVFEGATDVGTKQVALVFALMSCPVVSS